jgi:predicted nucleic acid-binding protein
MRVPKIYLETTMFNYYFDKEREAHPYAVRLFEEIGEGKYHAYTSRYVLGELDSTPEPKRGQMLGLVNKYNITMLDYSQEAKRLATMYVTEGIIPAKYLTDGIHIAVATVNDLDMILSLNFRHIVRKKTIELTEYINLRAGYRKILIYSPLEVADYEQT